MRIIGQFRDLDDPDQFVWLRAFQDMDSRRAALEAFYGGPVWRQHSARANATMADVSNVLLLRPIGPLLALPSQRPPLGGPSTPSSVIIANICRLAQPVDDTTLATATAGIQPLAPGLMRTLHALNTFPALPVREDANVVCWLQHGPGNADIGPPALRSLLDGPPQRLRLAPTARSLLR